MNLSFFILQKTYWGNSLNSNEGIGYATRKGLKNEY